MSGIRRLEHVGIGAAPGKFDETITFYERVFGWHRIKESPGQLAFIGDGQGGRLEVLANDAPPLPNPHHLAFVVDMNDFDAMIDSLREAGATVDEPTTNPFGDRLVFFSDPAGNRAQIVSRVEPLAP
jgi:predicted enzyme related to lactoylglutathione lyase